MLFGCIYVCTACFHTCKRVKLRRLKIHLLKGMKSSAEIEIEDILRTSDSLLEKNLKIFVLLLFSSNSLEKKGNITENPAETVGKYIQISASVL